MNIKKFTVLGALITFVALNAVASELSITSDDGYHSIHADTFKGFEKKIFTISIDAGDDNRVCWLGMKGSNINVYSFHHKINIPAEVTINQGGYEQAECKLNLPEEVEFCALAGVSMSNIYDNKRTTYNGIGLNNSNNIVLTVFKNGRKGSGGPSGTFMCKLK
jgi:hypothetical protein